MTVLLERIHTVKLAKKGSVIEVGQVVTASGWGKTSDSKFYSNSFL